MRHPAFGNTELPFEDTYKERFHAVTEKLVLLKELAYRLLKTTEGPIGEEILGTIDSEWDVRI